MDTELRDLSTPFLDGNGAGNSADVADPSAGSRDSSDSVFAPKEPPPVDFRALAQRPHSDAYKVMFEGSEVSVDSSDWRNSVLLRFQIIAAYVNFTLFGLADQCIGTIIPRLQDYYEIDDAHVGWIFLASTLGYFLMALVSEHFHRSLGVRGVGIFGALCMAVAFLTNYQKPPFFVFVVAYFFSGLGFGSLDACFNGWMGSLRDSNQLLGILHGFFGVGCMVSPPVVTYLIEKPENPWGWNDYYLVLSSVAASVLVFFAVVFRHETPAKYKFSMLLKEARRSEKEEVAIGIQTAQDTAHYRVSGQFRISDESEIENEDSWTSENHGSESSPDSNNPNDSAFAESFSKPADSQFSKPAYSESAFPHSNPDHENQPPPLSQTLKSGLIWAFSILMLLYVGAEAGFGTWLVSYIIRIQEKSPHYASYMATTFWMGLTLGRMVGGFVTTHFFANELNANSGYIFGSFFFQMLFCLLALTPLTWSLFPVVLLSGLLVGPIFPTLIVAAIRVLPVKYHASGVGFICAFGGGGAALVPFLIGAVAQMSKYGLLFYPYIIAFFYFVLFVSWYALKKRTQNHIHLEH